LTSKRNIYIASCVFTSRYPILSQKIQKYVTEHYGMEIVRCCVPNYKLQIFTDKMPVDYQDIWQGLPDTGEFAAGDNVYTLCHNCLAIIEETKPEVNERSLWEYISEDESFPFPNYKGRTVTLQDCWRTYDRRPEQEAVRAILDKMNIQVVERLDNFEKTNFCGYTLYEPCIPRNAAMAPRRFVDQAEGKFIEDTQEEKQTLMEAHCRTFETDEVVAYCHYCQAGLELGGADVIHIAGLLFEPEKYGGKKVIS